MDVQDRYSRLLRLTVQTGLLTSILAAWAFSLSAVAVSVPQLYTLPYVTNRLPNITLISDFALQIVYSWEIVSTAWKSIILHLIWLHLLATWSHCWWTWIFGDQLKMILWTIKQPQCPLHHIKTMVLPYQVFFHSFAQLCMPYIMILVQKLCENFTTQTGPIEAKIL